MMIIVNRIGDSITGSYNGKPFGVSFSEEKYAAMKALETKANSVSTMEELKAIVEEFEPLTHESYKELVETASPFIFVNKNTNKFYLKTGDKISSKPLPKALVNRILDSVDKKIDVLPLVKCWTRFLRPVKGRPEYTQARAQDFAAYLDSTYTNTQLVDELISKGLSEEVATERATTKQVAITQEGLLVCYKVSTEIRIRYDLNENEEVVQKSRYKKTVDPDTGLVTYDEPEYVEDRLFEPVVMGQTGDAFYSGDKLGHHIRVGKVHYLPHWSQVGYPGSKGLHCGGLKYIHGYQQEGTVTHNIFVDPMHIYGIAGLGYGNDGAMTVKQYFVHSSFAGPNRSIYHSSEYAKLTDAEFKALLEQVITETGELKNNADNALEEAKALA